MNCIMWKQKLISWLVILFYASGLHLIYSAKILAISAVPAKSHFNFNKQIMYRLVEAGHQVTFVSPFQEPEPPINFTYIVPKRTTVANSEDLLRTDFKSMSHLQGFRLFAQLNFPFWSDVMKITEIQTFLKSESKMYDILFVELTCGYECILPLSEKFKIPVIGTLSHRHWVHTRDVLGDLQPLAIPSQWLPLPRKMGFFQRLLNVFANLYARFLIKYFWESPLADFYAEYFPGFYLQSNRDISVVFSGEHASIFSTELTPKVVGIAGIHLTPIKPLPKMLEKFINESQNGVILLSFGSIVKSNVIDTNLRNIFRETFRNLQQRVIWKFEENVENISENVLISDWIPQRDILAHKNVKLFISHAGLNGMYEAIDAGVPLVSIPLFSDHPSNAGLIEDIGVGIRLDVNTLTKEKLLNAINNVLYDERYFKRMQKLSAEFKDRPMSPQESVVYWTEYVLRHNNTKHLEPTSSEEPSYQSLLLDIIVFIIFSALIVSLMFRLIYKLSCKILKNVRKKMKAL